MPFPKDFVWGAATAAYQIEGAAYEDGRGLSNWDMFCKKPGAVYDGHTGDIACDHYHRYKEDIALMKEMSIKHYRFSIAWSRILPEGTGKINQKGIQFYNNLIDELIKNDITPYITLYHWDLPWSLHIQGGWLNPKISDWFAEYAKVIAENFSDRVKYFMTFNEPQCFIGVACTLGNHAPGYKMPIYETIPMSHNVMVAHGKAVMALRQYGHSDIKIGYAPTGNIGCPETNSKSDVDEARRSTFAMSSDPENWFWSIAWFSDPVVLGRYPEDGLEYYGQYLPKGWEKDLEIIKQPLDFYAQNLYNGYDIGKNEHGESKWKAKPIGFPHTDMQWAISPKVLKWGPIFLYERYKLPIYITENGMACHDVVSLDGKVHDPNRIDYLNRYLLALREASEAGAKVLGYFHWTLTDNFEWQFGYSKRFGLVYVDYPTQKRIIKDSGYWYKKIIESNGELL